MRDQPDPIALLTIVAETLHADVIPNLSGAAAYQARIAANLVAIVTREMQHGPDQDTAETLRLRALLDVSEGELFELNRELAARLCDGRLALESPGVSEHLWNTTMSKLEVDQPTFARYRQLMS